MLRGCSSFLLILGGPVGHPVVGMYSVRMKPSEPRPDIPQLGVTTRQETTLKDYVVVPLGALKSHPLQELLSHIEHCVVGAADGRPVVGGAGSLRQLGGKVEE